MQAIAVGGFDQQDVGFDRRRRIRENRPSVTSKIAAEQDACSAGLSLSHVHVRRAEQVSRVDELELDAGYRLTALAKRMHLQPRQRLRRVRLRIERQGGLMLGVAALVGELGVLFLQVRGIGQHELAQVGRAGGAVNGSLEPLRNEPRQPAGMIDVRVGQHDSMNRLGRYWQRRPIALAQLLETLEQTTVEQDSLSVDVEQVLGAGDGTGGSEKRQRRHGRIIEGLTTFAKGLLVSICLCAAGASAQTARPEVHAHRLTDTDAVVLDGTPDEPFWQKAVPATNFQQRDPDNGAPASEKTDVRVVFDKDRIVLGVTCFDSEPNRLLGNQMQRDQSLESDDRFMWSIDPFLDGRSGYFFEINPSGAMGDGLITGPTGGGDFGGPMNKSWDGIWMAKRAAHQHGLDRRDRDPLQDAQLRSGHHDLGRQLPADGEAEERREPVDRMAA